MKRQNSTHDIERNSNLKQPKTNVIEEEGEENEETDNVITSHFIRKCSDDFRSNQFNNLARNAVTSVGAYNASINIEEENKISHIFLNTLKPWHLKATNQGHSGRCWMFAGLNIFRYIMIRGMDVKDFELSESYLFFWDKFERSNTLLQWYIDNPQYTQYDRITSYMSPSFLSDGGWWNFFSNLVSKYGLVPKSAMDETYQSFISDGMNEIICDRLMASICKIRKLQKRKSVDRDELLQIKKETLQQIYDCLVKFMGQPPEKFDWSYQTNDQESHTIHGLTPLSFIKLFGGVFDINDFVVLANIPNKDRPYYKMYEIDNCINVQGGSNCRIMNLPIEELKKYASKSIMKGMPVWFAGDVTRGFHPYKSALDENLFDTDLFFGKPCSTTKEEKILYRLTQSNHAMTLTGVNFDSKGLPERWQVENSWGFYDYETPGEDGFLSMSNHWFENDLTEVVIHKAFLSRNLLKVLESEPTKVDIWDSMSSALKVMPVGPPRKFNFQRGKRDRERARTFDNF